MQFSSGEWVQQPPMLVAKLNVAKAINIAATKGNK